MEQQRRHMSGSLISAVREFSVRVDNGFQILEDYLPHFWATRSANSHRQSLLRDQRFSATF